MCLVTTQKLAKKAKEDIIVYKIVRKSDSEDIFLSLYAKFPYEKNTLYITTLKFKKGYFFRNRKVHFKLITEGFHAYKSKIQDVHISLKEYLHNQLFKYFPYMLVECIIPEGANYYENNTEIVADQIIIKKIIKS